MHHWLESVGSLPLKVHSDSHVMKHFLIERKQCKYAHVLRTRLPFY